MTQITQAWLFTFFYRQTEQEHSVPVHTQTWQCGQIFEIQKHLNGAGKRHYFSEKKHQNHPKISIIIFKWLIHLSQFLNL